MKLEKLGKIYIGIGIGIFIAMIILNIIVYNIFVDIIITGEQHFNNIIQPLILQLRQQETNITNQQSVINLQFTQAFLVSTSNQILAQAIIFITILIATDIIVLIQITKLILDGAAMLAKN